jgi:hypothetical protein
LDVSTCPDDFGTNHLWKWRKRMKKKPKTIPEQLAKLLRSEAKYGPDPIRTRKIEALKKAK